MTTIASYGAALWLPSAVSALSQNTSNWISDSLQPSATSLGLPDSSGLQDFMNTGAAMGDALASSQANQAQGMAALAIQAAHNRVNADLAKQIDELANSTAQSSIPTTPSIVYLPDGSIINNAKNTYTLRDGTVLDITTGLKVAGTVVNVTA